MELQKCFLFEIDQSYNLAEELILSICLLVLYFLLRCPMKRLMCDVLIREGVGSQSGFLVLDMLLGSHLWEQNHFTN